MNPSARDSEHPLHPSADIVLLLDAAGDITWAGPSVSDHGLDAATLLGKPAAECFHHGSDAARFRAGHANAILRPGVPVTVDSLQFRNSALRLSDDSFICFPGESGNAGTVVVIRLHRVTQHQAPDHSGESEERLRQAIHLSQIGIFEHNHVTGEIYWSRESRKIYGWRSEERPGQPERGERASSWDVIHPDDRERVTEAARRAHAGHRGGLFDLEYRIVRRDGQIRWLVTRAQTFFEGEGENRRPVRTVGAVQDVTMHRQAARQLQLMQTSVDKCNVAIYWVNQQGRVTYANELASTGLGRTRDELLAMHVWDFDPSLSPDNWLPVWERLKRSGSSGTQTRHLRKDGTTFPVELMGTYVNADGEELVFVFARDISEQERAERERLLMHAAIEKSHTPFFILTRDGSVFYANEHACQMLGMTRAHVLNLKMWDIDPALDPESQQAVWELIEREGIVRVERTHRRADGSLVQVEITSNYVSFKDEEFILAFVQDITERRDSEQRANRKQRLESIGTMAGGIAHDLNNALTPILMTMDLLREQFPSEGELLNTVEQCANRAAGMVRHLLAYARGSEGKRVPVRPDQLIEEIAGIVKGTFPKNIVLQTRVENDLPSVLGDVTQLHQVLVNLAVNARDAMPHGGRLTIEAKAVDEAQLRKIPELRGAKAARYIVISVTDTGAGIPASDLEHLFEPFFTTKKPEAGTGLGLFTVAGIMRGHGGHIQVQSRPGQGSTFSIFVPAIERRTDAEARRRIRSDFRGNGESILFVDDEPAVCEAARVVLHRLNFKAITVTDGNAGLREASENGAALCAVITDLNMPNMDGLSFARALRKLLPDVPLIMASGRPEAVSSRELAELGIHVVLEKPFTEERLAVALQRALSSGRAQRSASGR